MYLCLENAINRILSYRSYDSGGIFIDGIFRMILKIRMIELK